MSLKSSITDFNRLPSITDIPKPNVKANIRADITPMTAGISTVKYGCKATVLSATADSLSEVFNNQG